MANRRDLHIGITGDAGGLDKAVAEAEQQLRGLDRELEKLNKDLTAQERVSVRAAAAVKQYGSEQDKAALAARRMGTEAKKAAAQAEQAQTRADAAAKAYERGLIDEEKALRAAARAEDATERAALKAAEAHRLAAKAAEDQAQQERKLARDAELGAAAENLAVLKASGRVKEHNALLRDLESRFGDLSKEGEGAFAAIEGRGEKAFQVIGSTAPGQIAIIVAALAAVPFAAAAAQAAVAGGLGGALIGVGLAAAKGDAQVQAALTDLAAHVKVTTTEISAPFKQTWLEIASTATTTFDELAPHLKQDFAALAPAVSRFVAAAGDGIAGLGPVLDSASRAAGRLLDSLSADAPEIFDNLGKAVQTFADGLAANPSAIPNLITNISRLLPVVANLLNYAEQVGPIFNLMYGVLSSGAPILSHLGDALSVLSFGLIGAGHGSDAANKALPPLASNATAAAAATDKLGQDMQTLASSTTSAEDKTKALTDAFARLLDPQQAVYRDTAQLQQGIIDLGTALARSGGSMGNASQSARDAKNAFDGLLTNARQLATDMTNSGDSIEQVRQGLMPYIGALYQAAGSNSQARDMVDAFVRSLGMVPPEFARAGDEVAGFAGKLNTLKVPMSGAQLQSIQLAEDFQTLTTATASAEDKANALTDAFTRLLDPALAAYQDTAHLRQGLDDLVTALKKSHGAMNDNTAAARASKDAFASVLKDAEQFATDLLRGGDSLDTIQRKLTPYILSLYKTAGANKDARTLVNAFARSVGLVPNQKGTKLTSNAAAQKKAIEAYQRSINNLRGKTVDIYQVMHLTTTQAYLNKRKAILGYAGGGIVHRATGGPIQRLADGGPSGMVSGPGTDTSDSILTALSNNEYVVNAHATRENLPLLEAINSGRQVSIGAAVASGASGGASAPIDYDRLAGAVAVAMRQEGVGAAYLDGQAITENVNRRIGRQTDQRRRTG